MKCYLCMLTQMEKGIRESHTGQPRLLRATCSISVFKTANAVICRWQRLSGQHCPPFQHNWVALQRATPLAGCIPSSPMDSCKSSLFKCTLTWSTSTKGNRPPPWSQGPGTPKNQSYQKRVRGRMHWVPWSFMFSLTASLCHSAVGSHFL